MKRYTVLRSRDRDFRHEWDGPVLSISPHEWVLVHRSGFLGNGPVSSNIFGRNERKINSQRSSWSKVMSPKKDHPMWQNSNPGVSRFGCSCWVHAVVCGVGWALFIFWVSEHHTTMLGIKKKDGAFHVKERMAVEVAMTGLDWQSSLKIQSLFSQFTKISLNTLRNMLFKKSVPA